METKRAAAMALIAVLAVAGLVAGLTACGGESPADETTPAQSAKQAQEQVADPPTEPIDVGTPEAIHEGAMMIEMRVGDTYAVELESNPTTGYGWELGFEFNERLLELVDHRYEAGSTLVGGGGQEIFTFRALAFGMVEFSFNYKRSWEDQVLKTGRYIFNIGVPAALADEVTEADAREIAANSECGEVGALKENAFYNDWSGTWWIDLDAQKEHCPNPACVVDVATRTAEVNWRCMGVPPPTPAQKEVVQQDVVVTEDAAIVFPQQEPVVGPRTAMVALLFGGLVIEEGCFRVNDKPADTSYLLVWPPDYSVSIEGDSVQILDGAGEVVVRVGDEVRISGGEIKSVRYLGEHVRQSLPDDCPGPYWVVGNEVGPATEKTTVISSMKSEVSSLENTVWVLVFYGPSGDLQRVLEDAEITLELDSEEGRLTGHTGCNGYFAGYETEGSRLSVVPPIGQTVQFCEGLMDQEKSYLAALGAVGRYEISGGQLRLHTPEGQVLVFTAE